MPIIHRSTVVPFSSEQMFALVNDIERYPDFLPWCKSTQIHSRSEDQVQATLEISKGIVHRSFTTINHLEPPGKMRMVLKEGPFTHLNGYWHFESLPNSMTKIDFQIDFEFNNRLLDFGFAPVFKHITQTMVTAFTQRARQIYG